MALLQRPRLIRQLGALLKRSLTTQNERDIKKSVFISQSKDIYTNLALEDWLYRNFDFRHHHVLMLWQNDPCVVIGRHQNPWLEANVPHLPAITADGVKFARRNSGGGTVYHDLGNLNLTFFAPRERYDRKYNLNLVSRSLFREYGMSVDVSPREDLTVRDHKISGTAAKLGRPNSYHHCTLLVKVNKPDLHQALQKADADIETNATKSVKSAVMNLCEENPAVNVTDLMRAVGWEYLRTPALTLTDAGMAYANEQKGFQMINPTEQWFAGLDALRDQFASWDWLYGKTPTFTVTRKFSVPESVFEGPSDELKVTMTVEQGRIGDIKLYMPQANGMRDEFNVVSNLKGHIFSLDTINKFDFILGHRFSDKDKFVSECVKEVMTSV